MNYLKKILIAILSWLFLMLLLPLAVINLAPADSGMGFCFLLFFLINPLFFIALGILAGTDFQRLWWIPIVSAILFPLFFALVVQEFVIELFFYSAIYFFAGFLSMFGMYLGKKRIRKRQNKNTD